MGKILQLSQYLLEFSEHNFLVHDSPFLEPAYLEGLEKALNAKAEIFVADDESFAIALYERQNYQGKTLPPFTPFSQFWLKDSGNSSLDLKALDEFLSTKKGRHHIHLEPGLSTSCELEKWDRNEFLTYHVDLASGDWSGNYSTSVKRLLKKYSGQCQVEKDEHLLLNICKLVCQSYEKSKGRPPIKVGEMQALADSCINAGLASCYAIKEKNTREIKAGIVVLKSEYRSYYWLAGGEKGPWMTVLLDRLFQDLSEEGIKYFDFMGANTPRIAEFKRRFGGELVTYAGYEKVVGLKAKLRQGISSLRENAG